MTRRFLFPALLCGVLAAGGRAADPADLDRTAIDVLKDLHNRGADLYNAADAPGALKTYEAALRAVGPFLGHHPKLQKAIDDGLADAAKLEGPKAQAFKLHEVIDQVRTELKAAKATDPKPTPPMLEPKRLESETKPPAPMAAVPALATPRLGWALPWPW